MRQLELAIDGVTIRMEIESPEPDPEPQLTGDRMRQFHMIDAYARELLRIIDAKAARTEAEYLAAFDRQVAKLRCVLS